MPNLYQLTLKQKAAEFIAAGHDDVTAWCLAAKAAAPLVALANQNTAPTPLAPSEVASRAVTARVRELQLAGFASDVAYAQAAAEARGFTGPIAAKLAAPSAPTTKLAVFEGGLRMLRLPNAKDLDGLYGKPVRVHSAYAGKFVHPASGAFTFTADTFKQMKANFERHPEWKPCVDLSHDSAHDDKAIVAGYVAGLEVDGDSLYCNVRFNRVGDAAMTQLGMKYVSVTVGEKRDEHTGKSLGAWLHSLALTKNPFLKNLRPLY